ncbi:MAG: alpha/beta hydrolase, partial [Candidatus Binatia bacterium]
MALLLFGLGLTGCGGSSNVVNTSANNQNVTQQSPATNANSIAQTVNITSPDGVILVGTFLEAAKSNSPGLLLLHQWQSDRHSYDEFAVRMQQKGFAILSIDGRGFGESTKKADGTTVVAGRTPADVKAMLGDVSSAFDFLAKQKNIDPTRIGIVGASYGSSLAIMYAADNPKVPAVALLSPGLNYFGNMLTLPAVEKYGDRDLFIVASTGDTESALAAESFEKIGNTRYGFFILPVGSSHGTEMFKYRDKTDGPPKVEDGLEFFLTTRLG